jgi:peptidoglycan hydrolase-like protein with peptidoglycan-binding domain
MTTRINALCAGILALSGLFVAAPAMAQTFSQSYYYPQQYAQPQYGSCPALSYNLTIGSTDYSTGGQVSQLQAFLRARYGDARLVGGYYGQLTTYYVSRFQQEQGVYPVTGGVGPLTRQAIQRACGGYTPYPNPNGGRVTFRLDRDFSLKVGETGELRNENLTITLAQIVTRQYGYGYYYSQEPEAVRITVTEGCARGTYCFYAPSQTYTLEDGDDVDFRGWNIEVRDIGARDAAFRVTETDDDANDNDDASIEVTRPSSGDDVEQGDTLRISWDSEDAPRNASVVLELYEEDGDRVGTIAISDDEDGAYSWRVPVRNTFCTQQFPNGLCGYDLDGDYYVKASLTEGNGFGNGRVLDSDTSGTFTIDR